MVLWTLLKSQPIRLMRIRFMCPWHSVANSQNFAYLFEGSNSEFLILKNKLTNDVELKTTYQRINR